MNILQILPELNVGGGETGTIDLARYLVSRGHKAVVVSAGGELVKELEAAGAVHYRLPVHRKSPWTMARMVPELARIIRGEKIDIVHARSRVPAWIAWFACLRTRTVFITTCHGYYSKHLFSEVMGWGKRVIVASSIISRHMVRDFRVRQSRIRLIPRGVNLDRFTYTSPDERRKKCEFHVGMVGRITPLKGHMDFFRAMAKLAEKVPGLQIWIAGDAPPSKKAYKKRLLRLVEELGLSERVHFLGTRRDIPAILSGLDALVLATTTQEAFGRVIVEAHASGVPVVATKVGGVVEIIEDGRTGLLVPPRDPDAMAAAVMRIQADCLFATGLAADAFHLTKEKYSLEMMARDTVKVYREALEAKKILLLKFSAVGDLVLSTAAFRAIRAKFGGEDRITVLVDRTSAPVMSFCPYVNEVMVSDKAQRRSFIGFLKLAHSLRRGEFDIVIDLQNNRWSHLLAFLSGARERYGYDNRKFGFLLNHRVRDTRPPIDPVVHQFRILRMLDIHLDDPRLELWPGDEDQRYVDGFLDSAGARGQRLVGINIAASPRWKNKNWPPRHIARLCEELSRRGLRCVITGMRKDIAACDQVKAMCPGAGVIDACGRTTVNQLACLIRRCSLYISPDSAPLHIAASQGVPFVALFGPTDFRRHLPPSKKYIVIQKTLACSPCYSTRCTTRLCMETIMPDEVVRIVDTFLEGNQTHVDRSYSNG
ncbi:MAG: glycosyltransferase [Deltaproteobacteria bacterium]